MGILLSTGECGDCLSLYFLSVYREIIPALAYGNIHPRGKYPDDKLSLRLSGNSGSLVTFRAAQPFREMPGCCRGKRAGEVLANICRREPADLRPVLEQKQIAVDPAGDHLIGEVNVKDLLQQVPGFGVPGIPNNRDLLGLSKVEIERAQHMWKG